MKKNLPKLFAIITVAHKDGRTLYVKRSSKMANYPGVWSLPSIQFDPTELADHEDLSRVMHYIRRLSMQRLGGIEIALHSLLTCGSSDANPIGRDVHLYLYSIDLAAEPNLNQDFYTDRKWMTAAEFEDASAGQACGLCVRLWADYAWLRRLTDRPFLPRNDAHAN